MVIRVDLIGHSQSTLKVMQIYPYPHLQHLFVLELLWKVRVSMAIKIYNQKIAYIYESIFGTMMMVMAIGPLIPTMTVMSMMVNGQNRVNWR